MEIEIGMIRWRARSTSRTPRVDRATAHRTFPARRWLTRAAPPRRTAVMSCIRPVLRTIDAKSDAVSALLTLPSCSSAAGCPHPASQLLYLCISIARSISVHAILSLCFLRQPFLASVVLHILTPLLSTCLPAFDIPHCILGLFGPAIDLRVCFSRDPSGR